MNGTKPFPITKRMVWEAWKRIKANQGGAGVDHQSLADFERKVGNNLYKLWNRLASGSYMPSPVLRVEIPKGNGGTRPLGIPTVTDRIAQMVVKQALEPELEGHFHPDSYGYRPGKSAHQALAQTRQRCWKYDWVLDLDIKSFFDSIPHDLLLRAVQQHSQETWVGLYIERWLKAPVEMPDGTLQARDQGTPQGGVASPLLANLFLHYAFDRWMVREYPDIPFERYADDVVCHCRSKRQAERLKDALERRLGECGLMLHPEKTRWVYCRDSNRSEDYPHVCFDFLGYTFRPRKARNRWGQVFTSFGPAISNKSATRIRQEIRSWEVQTCTNTALEELAQRINATIRGWINYYGAYYKSALYPILGQINHKLAVWATRKFKRFRGHLRRAARWLSRIRRQQPDLFVHWSLSQAG